MQRRHFLSSVAAATAVAAAPGMALAQDTSRPIRIIVPFPPGGATDMVPRNLQDVLGKLLSQTVVIENKAGAGGSIGMAEVARANDGVTFGIATLSTHGVNPAVLSKLPYDAIKDFVGVTEIVKAPGVIMVNPAILPVKNFAELVAYLKANPGKVSYATPGNGTIGHMWGELFKSATGTAMVHIPYRGAGPAINDVLGGQVPVYFDQVASSLPHVKSGKLKALAVSWSGRLDVLPDVPTYGELGYPANNDPSWFGMVAPAGTPADLVLRMQQAVATALKDASVRERLALQGLYASGTTPAQFTKQIASEIDKMKKVAEFARVRLD
jgi:tripartite-type tricarboxylate transporter receptor subunit TctC